MLEQLRSALRPARPLRWVAIPALVVLVVLLLAIGRITSAHPGVRVRDDLRAAGFTGAEVSVEQARPDDGEGDAAHVEVRFDSRAGADADRQMGDEIARLVWLRYDGRLGAVTVVPDGGAARRLTSAAMLEQFGDRPGGLHERRYSVGNRSGLVTLLALLAVLTTGVLVVCSALTALLVMRAGRRTGAARP